MSETAAQAQPAPRPASEPAHPSAGVARSAGDDDLPASGILDQAARDDIRAQVEGVLRDTFDPEIPVSIWELGLVYDLVVEPTGSVRIAMTLTSPACPVAESLPPAVEARVNAIPGVASVRCDVVWEPPWTPEMMSPEAKLLLDMF